ncbi:SRPBCC family protein [Actinophytocola glycyrrhizae]|uniref:SRPBCC domain-containing protein n=1 Tax=Actinophytocola glycyrrhizae TaxID=2044873 RepID=A0ABV9RZQ4_9PSEU
MGREFASEEELRVDATPDEVWAAIATGPGIDSWFMGRNEVDAGRAVRQAFAGYTPQHEVTAWEPGKWLAYGSRPAPDGRFVAFEFLIEGRDRGSTVLRVANSGFVPGDDWADEFEAMAKGNALFLATLATYLDHFAGRFATPVTAFGPMVTDWPRTRAKLVAAIGRDGDRVRFTPGGLPPVDGVVYFENEDVIGIRADDAIYRFLRGFRGPVMACHHIFTDISPDATEQAWVDWLNTKDLT